MSEAQTSVAVQTLISSATRSWFDRWFDATIDALSVASQMDYVARWRVVVGGIGVQDESLLDAVAVAAYTERCRALGGEFVYRRIDASESCGSSHHRLAELGDEEFLLVVGSTTVMLGSTITRMLAARNPACVEARMLPLSPKLGRDSDPVGSLDTCRLFSRASFDENTSVISEAVKTIESAVAFHDHHPTSSQEGADPGNGTLLEEALTAQEFVAAKRIVERAFTTKTPPLLSIVMRSQATRPEALRDVLLCLAGQSDGRFELLLVVHDGDKELVQKVLKDQPTWLKSRTRILSATGGTRSSPLNVGLHYATGSLVAFLDDDDLVFGHWVESFLQAAVRNPGRLIRTISGVQRLRTVAWADGVRGHTTESEITTPYPPKFDLIDHLRVNMTPFMAYAFPATFFTIFGGADENLEVCEDWDLALRAASVLGVVDVPNLTAIYRRWSSGNDSYSSHDQEIWERDMRRVRVKRDAEPILLPPGSATELALFSSIRGMPAELDAVYSSSSWRLTAPIRRIATALRKAMRREPRSLDRAAR